MPSDGEVPLRIVELVLQAHGVSVSRGRLDGLESTTTMARDDIVVATVLPDPVSRRMLHFLKRKFNIPIHHFYHPLMAPTHDTGEIQ